MGVLGQEWFQRVIVGSPKWHDEGMWDLCGLAVSCADLCGLFVPTDGYLVR